MVCTKCTVSLAFSLPLLASVLLPLSTAAPTTRFPTLPRMANQSAPGVSPADGTQKYYATALCTPAQMVGEAIAWADARRYAEALASWRPNQSFQPAMDLYMGTDSDGPLSELLQANIHGALRVHDLSTWPDRQRVFVFCDEPAPFATYWNACGSNQAIAYVWTDEGIYYDNHYVVFCPDYWTSETPSLPKIIYEVDNGLKDSQILDTFIQNRGEIYFHESMHLADLTTAVGHPVVDNYLDEPRTYGPLHVALEAAAENTVATIHIADAYSCAAAAIFAQQHYNLTDPPLPSEDVLHRLRPRSFPLNSYRRNRFPLPPQFPNPDTPNNYIVSNDFAINPVESVAQDSTQRSSGPQLLPGSSSLLKRVVWPNKSPCTLENGCTRSMAATIATTISGPLICFLVAGLCVLSFFL